MSELICKRGHDVPYEELMALIDLTFGFQTPETQFLGLLPKLYKPEYRPQDSNYVVLEDGKAVAAVGAYDHEVTIAGHHIACRGIGNVAVHPAYRGKSYMKLAMEAALDDMVQDGIALSTLGGRRQRYQYFSYDKCGICHHFSVTADNLRHTFGTLEAPYEARVVTEPHDAVLDEIKALSDSGMYAPTRSREHFLDIARTWHASLYAVTDPTDGRLVGYAIAEPGGLISELRTVEEQDFMSLVRTLFSALDRESMVLRLPDHETAALAMLAPVAEGIQTGCSMSYTVLNYALMIEATMALKERYATLTDGHMTVLIHGRAGDECLSVTVADGQSFVNILPLGTAADYEWSHLEAMNILFAPFSPLRNTYGNIPHGWLPLPIWMYRADEV